MRAKIIIILLGFLTANCNNIGFVEKAKAVASGEFGFEVFAMGGAANGSFLIPATDPFGYPTCMNLSGIPKANCYCQSEAATRQNSGTFRAWLSLNGSVDAICNIQGLANNSCTVDSGLGPFLQRGPSGYVVLAESYAELSTTGFRQALETTAKVLYTGSNASGRATGSDCTVFTSSAGSVTAGDVSKSGLNFTQGEVGASCGGTGSFLCMKQAK